MGRWSQAARRGNAVSRIGWPVWSLDPWTWTPNATVNWTSSSDPDSWNYTVEQDTGSGWVAWKSDSVAGNLRTVVPGGMEPGAVMIRVKMAPVIGGRPGTESDWLETEV